MVFVYFIYLFFFFGRNDRNFIDYNNTYTKSRKVTRTWGDQPTPYLVPGEKNSSSKYIILGHNLGSHQTLELLKETSSAVQDQLQVVLGLLKIVFIPCIPNSPSCDRSPLKFSFAQLRLHLLE